MDILTIKRSSLRMRFIYSFVFVIIITIFILSLANHVRWNRNYLRQIRDEGLILTQTLAQGSIDPIIRNDYYTLNEYVTSLIEKKNIAYVAIADRHDRILAQSADALNIIPAEILKNVKGTVSPHLLQTYFSPALKTRINDIAVPVRIDSQKWGTVQVGFSLEHLRAEIVKNLFVVILTGCVSVFIGIAVALVLSRFVTDPIEKFVHSMKTIAAGDLEQEIRIDASNEFSLLARSFNHMAGSLRESKEELKKTYQQLIQKEKMAALGGLTARIAHEIKNPLGIIKASAQILVDEHEKNDVKIEVGGYIIEEVNRLDAKVRELLNHARPQPPALQETDINEVLEKSIRFFESQKLEEKQIRIIRKFSPALPALPLDREQVRQVVLNLMINACEALPDGGEIRVATEWTAPSV
ncbi:MAG: HAMP domain-containing protein, partial [bacterium]|nr:HAMP domain-containing protein [bacterium]